MNRLLPFFLAGLLLTGAAGRYARPTSGERAMSAPAARPLGPSAPATSPFKTFLPIMFNRYAPGYVSPFGIDMYTNNNNADGQAQMTAAGAGWETVVFNWSSVEPNAPVAGTHTYNWVGF